MIPDTVATVGSVAIVYNYLKHIIGKVFNIHLAVLKFIMTVGSGQSYAQPCPPFARTQQPKGIRSLKAGVPQTHYLK